MRQKTLFFSLIISLFVLGCGGDKSTTNETAATGSVTTSDNDSDDDDNGTVMHQMPTGEQIDDAYKAILDKADVDSPELMEVYINLSRSIDNPKSDRANLMMQFVSPTNKNKIVLYRYDFGRKRVEGPQPVTLSSGLGAKEEFLDTYDEFKGVLFNKSQIMDFDEADKVYEQAIAKSGYAPADCYVDLLQFKYFPRGGLRGDVSVQSTRSTSASRHLMVDKAGNAVLD